MDLALEWQERRNIRGIFSSSPATTAAVSSESTPCREVRSSVARPRSAERRWRREAQPHSDTEVLHTSMERRRLQLATERQAEQSRTERPPSAPLSSPALREDAAQSRGGLVTALQSDHEHHLQAVQACQKEQAIQGEKIEGVWTRVHQLETAFSEAHEALRVKFGEEISGLREGQHSYDVKSQTRMDNFELELTTALEERAREADRLLEHRLIEAAEKLQQRIQAVEEGLADDRRRLHKLEEESGHQRVSELSSLLEAEAGKVLQEAGADLGARVDTRLLELQTTLRQQLDEATGQCSRLQDQAAVKISELDSALSLCTRSLEERDRNQMQLQSLDADMRQVWRRLAEMGPLSSSMELRSQDRRRDDRLTEDLERWRHTLDLELAAMCRRIDAMDSRLCVEVPRAVESRLEDLDTKLRQWVQRLEGDPGYPDPPWVPALRSLGIELKGLLAAQVEDSAVALRSVARMVGDMRTAAATTEETLKAEGVRNVYAIPAN